MLATSGEWYITMANYDLADEIDDCEWANDYGHNENIHTRVGDSHIYHSD